MISPRLILNTAALDLDLLHYNGWKHCYLPVSLLQFFDLSSDLLPDAVSNRLSIYDMRN
jgi:hypothetical protein